MSWQQTEFHSHSQYKSGLVYLSANGHDCPVKEIHVIMSTFTNRHYDNHFVVRHVSIDILHFSLPIMIAVSL